MKQSQQILVAGLAGELGQALSFFGRQVDLGISTAQGEMEGIATVGQELGVHPARVPALRLELRHRGRHHLAVALRDGAEELDETCGTEAAQETLRLSVRDLPSAVGGELIE